MMTVDRLQVHVVRSVGDRWCVHFDGRLLLVRNQPRRRAAIAAARRAVESHVAAGGLVQIVIHDATGEIVDDVTLPRSSDPRRSRG
jgi:hypothetical protein